MGNYINDLNDLITAKSEIKNIIQDTLNENPSEVFSYYPSYIARIAASSGGGSIDGDTVNTYIAAYLSTYNYIDQDTLSYNSYITLADIPSIDLSSYVTYSYAYETYPTYSYTDNKYFGGLQAISGFSDGNVITNIGESFDSEASTRRLYFQMTYVPSYAYVESYYTSKSELSQAGYLTSVPNTYPTYAAIENMSYITMTDVSACGYLTQHQDISNLVSYTSNSPYDTIINLQGASKISGEDGLTIDAGFDFIYLDSDVYVSADLITNDVMPYNNTYNLGNSSHEWAYTYTKNLILNGTNIESIFGNYYTDGQVDSEISASLAYYYTKTQINNASYTSKSQVNGMFSYDSSTGVLTITTIS